MGRLVLLLNAGRLVRRGLGLRLPFLGRGLRGLQLPGQFGDLALQRGHDLRAAHRLRRSAGG
ncbi:MAG: hypothetical protein HZY76_00935 [Anaerolineae bacterium]|nr:MAG: hypothetical protein HZY76_00935 [Anaerolineae bacterium]